MVLIRNSTNTKLSRLTCAEVAILSLLLSKDNIHQHLVLNLQTSSGFCTSQIKTIAVSYVRWLAYKYSISFYCCVCINNYIVKFIYETIIVKLHLRLNETAESPEHFRIIVYFWLIWLGSLCQCVIRSTLRRIVKYFQGYDCM